MRRSDRVAVLQALLARVQENASKRRRELGLDVPHAVAAPEPPPAPPPPAPKPPPTKEDLNWTSLLASELAPARESKRPPAPAPVAAVVRAPIPPPPPEPPRRPEAALAAQPVDEIEELGPRSELTRAIRLAAERPDEALSSEAMWRGAADDLKQRPSTVPPVPHEEEPVQIAPHRALPVIEESDEVEPDVTGYVEPAEEPRAPSAPSFEGDLSAMESGASEAEPEELPRVPTLAPPPSLPVFGEHEERAERRAPRAIEPAEFGAGMDAHFVGAARPPATRGLGVMLGFALVGVVAIVVGVVLLLREDPPSMPVSAAATTTAPPSVTSVPPVVERTGSAAVVTSSAPSVSTLAPRPTGLPSPPPIRNKTERGLLWVESELPLDVYVNGVRVGKSGSYIHLDCGLKNVRLAKANPPPPGDSFPSWMTDGKAVSIPCGEVYVYANPAP